MPPEAAGVRLRTRDGKSFPRLLSPQSLKTAWRQTAGAVANVLAPSDCRVCGGPLLEASRFAVCDRCVNRLRAEAASLCSRCGERLPLEEAAGVGFSRESAAHCEQCTAEPPQFVQASAFGSYDGTLRAMIRLHKFEGMEELAAPLGTRLAVVLRRVAQSTGNAPLYVVAVPLYGNRRRYNQSAQVADEAVRELRRTGEAGRFSVNHGALRRVRATDSQSHLSPAQRRQNVRGAFAVSADVTGWTAVLVDDVYTTGATAAECTRMLLAAGAEAVHVVTLARTQPDRVALWGASPG